MTMSISCTFKPLLKTALIVTLKCRISEQIVRSLTFKGVSAIYKIGTLGDFAQNSEKPACPKYCSIESVCADFPDAESCVAWWSAGDAKVETQPMFSRGIKSS